MERLLDDIGFGFRTLIANPTFSLIAVLTLALGIGATTAMFTLVNGVLLKPLPFPNSEQLVFFGTVNKKTSEEDNNFLIRQFERIQDVDSPFQEMAYYAYDQATLRMGDQHKPFTTLITQHNFLSMFGVKPMLGRWYDENDVDTQSVLISHTVWEQEFERDPQILSRIVQLDNQDYQVLGVMPPNYSSTGYTSVDLWRPISKLDRPVVMAGRLNPGLTISQAEQQSSAIQRIVNEFASDSENIWQVRYVSMLEDIVGNSRPSLYLLLASVGAVFLIAVLNVVNLSFAHYSNRSQELAIRVAVGASRGRLMRQLFTESLLLCSIGGLLGLLLSAWAFEWIKTLMASRLPRLHEAGLDQTALLIILVLISLSALATTLIPASSILNPGKLASSIKLAGRQVTGDRNSQRIRRMLVSGEVCVAVVLLICAGLLLRSYQKLADEDTGFNGTDIITGHVWMADTFEPKPSTASYWENLRAALANKSGVLAVAATSTMPMSRTGIDYPVTYSYPGAPAVPRGEEPRARIRSISPGYFELLEIPVLAGRKFDFSDTKDSPKVVIINQELANSAWPGQDAIGQTLGLPQWEGGDHTVVGVVGNVKHRGLRAVPDEEFYLPVAQHAYKGMTYLLKTDGESTESVKSQMLKTSVEMEPTAPMIAIESLDELTNDSVVEEKLLLTVLAAFAGIALALASVGVYGISDNVVRQRTNEIGIRMAIGARPGAIRQWIIKDTSSTVLLGAILGLLLALIASQVIASRLYGVNTMEPLIFATVPTILFAVGVIASWIPASRATRIHPQQALHNE
ncbi:MAG: ABC transporter permease [Pseudomonadota bacterium]